MKYWRSVKDCVNTEGSISKYKDTKSETEQKTHPKSIKTKRTVRHPSSTQQAQGEGRREATRLASCLSCVRHFVLRSFST